MFVTQTTNIDVRLEPELSQWDSIVRAAQGQIFGKDITVWRRKCRKSMGLPEHAQLVVVGHQPEFFHPGILAKFIAGDVVAQKIGGELVHLVVDHHVGSFNTIEIPERQGNRLVIQDMHLALLDHEIAMKYQKRVVPTEGMDPIAEALINATGNNAAMQFASATDALMSPWATVDHLVGSSELLQTEFGFNIIEEMYKDPDRCRDTYNNAIANYPDCGITMLANDELPMWHGMRNASHGTLEEGVQPRALLLTLLARVILGDLFVHGTGGMSFSGWNSRYRLPEMMSASSS